MSFRLRLLITYLRLILRPMLERAAGPAPLRRALRRAAFLLPAPPARANFGPIAPKLGAMAAAGAQWWFCGPSAAKRTLEESVEDDAPRSAILYFHGGAFWSGSPALYRSLIWRLAETSGVAVFALKYRLAPEHPFPAAFEDAVSGFDALAQTLGENCKIALVGSSNGGGLALALAAELSARQDQPQPAAIAAFSPIVDLCFGGRSHRRNARRDAVWPAGYLRRAAAAYLGDANPMDPRVSPLFAEWPTPPPPALIQCSAREALCDDATRMASALQGAGGDVRLEMWRTTPHDWTLFAPSIREADDAVAAAGRFLALNLKPPRNDASYAAHDAGGTPLPQPLGD